MMLRFSGLLPKNQFARSVFALASGTVASQAILIASAPVLTRLYSPSEFGVFSVFLSILGIIGAISALRFELAIPLPEDDHEASSIIVLGLMIVASLSVVFFAIVIGAGDHIVSLLNAAEIAPYLWLMPLAFLFTGVFLLMNMWCVRIGVFHEMAKAKVTQSFTMVAVQILGAALGAMSLIVGRVAGQFAAALRLLIIVRKSKTISIQGMTLRDVQQTASTYRKFPLISTWAALASSVGASVTPLLFASHFGLDVAGYYAMTMTVMISPMSVIGVAVQNAFYRRAVEAHRRGHLADIIHAVQSHLVLATMPVFTLLGFVLPQAFILVFGASWETSGTFAAWILPWMFLQLTVAPCTGVFPILDRLGIAFFFDLSLAIAPFIAFFASLQISQDPLLAVKSLSALAGMLYLVRLAVAYRLSGGRALQGLLVIVRWGPIAIAGVMPMILLQVIWPESATWLPAQASAFVFSLMVIIGITWRVWQFQPRLDVDTPPRPGDVHATTSDDGKTR